MTADLRFEAAVRAASAKKPAGMGDFAVREMVRAALDAMPAADGWQPIDTAERMYDWNVIVADTPSERMAELVREAVRNAFAGQAVAAKKLGGPVVLNSSRILLPYTKEGPYRVAFQWVRAPEPRPLPAPPDTGE